jgi:hypothetical protein
LPLIAAQESIPDTVFARAGPDRFTGTGGDAKKEKPPSEEASLS